MSPLDLARLVDDTLHDPDFQALQITFQDRAVRTWSSLEERALQFGLARPTQGAGMIVELGSFCGGSAALFAKGLAASCPDPSGRVVCVDPLLGAPPWLAVPSSSFTLDEMQGHFRISACLH